MVSQKEKKGNSVKAPTSLLCEYVSNPLGVDVSLPRFSWVLKHSERGQVQSAYQVLVSNSQANLDAERGDQWNSGKVASKESTNVIYKGSDLQSGKTSYWKVRIWDKDGKMSPWSKVATFEMGLLSRDDWRGKWIEGKGYGESTFSDPVQGTTKMPYGYLLRKEFSIEKDIAQARVYVSGLGYYELRINGDKVGEVVLDPGWTDYKKRVLYSTYDVGKYLRKGKNAVGIMLGNGRYIKAYGYGPPKVILQLNIEFTDDSSESIVTDESWKVGQSPITENSIYNGEVYDARLEGLGWDTPFYDDSDWDAARIADEPGGKLVSQASFPPIKVSKIIQPMKITNPESEVYIYDFGQNFTGWVRLCLSGARGTRVKLRYAELLHEDGMLNVVPNRGAKATDAYILKGEGQEVYEPRFTYHGFRYVEVTGFPGTPTLESIEGRVVHSAVEPTGGFICSNSLINSIHKNVLWGQLSNLMSIPTDCPQRDERMGWMGDAQLVAEEAIYNFGMAGFYIKWLEDIGDSQAQDGSVPDVVPAYWSIYPADPTWGTACVVIPWYLYQYYGDRRILEKYYSGIKKWVDFLTSKAKDDILSYSKYGDWCPPAHIKPVDTPGELTSSWYYYHDTLILSKIAHILDKSEDAKKYAELSEKIKKAFNKEFLKENCYSGEKYSDLYKKAEALFPATVPEDKKKEMIKKFIASFLISSQTCNVLALFLDIVPEDKQKAVLKNLIDDIVVTHSNHLNTGIVGTRYILDVLTKYGRTDLAYKLATQTTYPGWGYMLREGATTLWERWEYLVDSGMNSHNHIMFGSIDAWFYKVLAGINIDPAGPGFGRTIIKPYVVGDLNYVSASIRTMRGMISSSWKKSDHSLALNIILPVNTQAKVSVPKMNLGDVTIKESGKTVWENSSYIEGIAGITGASEDDEYVIFNVGSGSYSFELLKGKS
ncbi:MAG: Bacterial alpha-L-rhamnosidase [Clostridia bacterium]|nr:Bacterial alpha-L-rhamnosidase [Clostridia bacterium]